MKISEKTHKNLQTPKNKNKSQIIQLIPYPPQLNILTNNSKSSLLFHIIVLIILTTLISYQISTLTIMTEKFKQALLSLLIILTYISFIIIPNPKRYQGYSLIFFKLLSSLSLVYFIVLCFLTILDNVSLKYLFVILDPKLAGKIEERDYSMKCDVFTPESEISYFENIYHAIDVYVAAHFVGWMVKTFVFRNHLMIWTLSAGFEVYELSLKHLLPNFAECWWDNLLLDLFGCNLIGIVLGYLVINKLGMRKYDWFYENTEEMEKMSYFQQIKYCFSNVDNFIKEKKWNFLLTPNNYLGVIFLIVNCSFFDLSNFFNKAIFDIPSNHIFLAIRIMILGFFCILVTSEYYDYIKNKDLEKKLSFNIILFISIVSMEMFLFFKNVDLEFFAPLCPLYIKIFWSFITFILFTLLVFSVYNKKISLNKK